MEFVDSGAIVDFKDIGADTAVLKGLVGQTVWERMFHDPNRQPSAEDVLPNQLMRLVAYQIRSIASKMSGDDYKAAKQEGTEACKEQRAKAVAPY